MQRGHNPFHWVVTQDGTDSDLHSELELMSFGGELREERRTDERLALVVVDGPALPKTQRGSMTGPLSTTAPGSA